MLKKEGKINSKFGDISYILSVIENNTDNNYSNICVILVHGLNSSKNSSTNILLEKELNNIGISTIRFDFYAHGDSEGDFKDLLISKTQDNLEEVISFVKSKGFKKIVLIGSSFGGFNVLIKTATNSNIDLLILKSAVSNYYKKDLEIKGEKFMNEFEKNDIILYNKGKNDKEYYLKYNFVQEYKENRYNGWLQAKEIKILTLIFHGTDDNIVPFSQSVELVKIIKGSKLILLNGADHRFSKKEDKKYFINKTIEFIVENLNQYQIINDKFR